MQKKVYTKDLSLEEIIDRLKKGEEIYSVNSKCYSVYHDGFIMFCDENGKLLNFNCGLSLGDDCYSFLDEVEEPEADESCIGKLCYFWDDKEEDKRIDILEFIDKGQKRPFYNRKGWVNCFHKHCRPLTKEEALALVKEN